MKGEIELYNISFLILKVELHFKKNVAALIEGTDQYVLIDGNIGKSINLSAAFGNYCNCNNGSSQRQRNLSCYC